jgi:heptosyltransferase III
MAEGAEHIVLSRTDSIGDVMLTLPMAGLLKQRFPQAYITFLGRGYTKPILECCSHVDRVLTLEELTLNGECGAVNSLRNLHADAFVHVFPVRRLAQWVSKAAVPHRIGTSHRWWHWLDCDHRISFSRRRSDLHEAQLNVKLLAPFGITNVLPLEDLARHAGFHAPAPDATVADLLRKDRCPIILHPMSSGSAVEWGLENFSRLIQLLHPARFQVIITGTGTEAERYRQSLPMHLPHVTDAGGRLDLHQLIALIGASRALVAASTGPLHIAAACGIRAVGLFANERPIHPGRWAPIGRDAHVLVEEDPQAGDARQRIRAIAPEKVLRLLEELVEKAAAPV